MTSACPKLLFVCVPFYDTVDLYGGLMFRLVGLSMSGVVLTKLPTAACVFVLVDTRCLCLCSSGNA